MKTKYYPIVSWVDSVRQLLLDNAFGIRVDNAMRGKRIGVLT